MSAASTPGTVYLVGSGPGDPELMTLKAVRLVKNAEVILYDNLGAEDVLDLAQANAEKIYVGKKASQHTLRQEEINQLLIDRAQQGKQVVRLKGGDPFIFGRGGEEIEALAAQKIPFVVVPGITAASGCAAYAGIPLTHRDHAQSCIFATGHLQDNSVHLDWPVLARPNQTVVFYMGIAGLREICEQLIAHGLAPRYPAAIVEHGTSKRQRVITAELSTLPQKAAAYQIRPPALIIVGTVVNLHKKLGWFTSAAALPYAGSSPELGHSTT